MKKHIINTLFALAAVTPIVIGAVFQQKEKLYPIYHTKQEWGRIQAAQIEIHNISNYSCLPGDARYFIDSVTNGNVNDIGKQVKAAEAADTVKTKKP